MLEIGGYIELDTFRLPMLHENALALNCGRNALAYLIELYGIKRIRLPYFLCSSVFEVCEKYGLRVRCYHVGRDFLPVETDVTDGEWFYLVNYYGQVHKTYIEKLHGRIEKLIVDQAQAYFEEPLSNVDTLYTCRKFFGVSDGAFLYTKQYLNRALQVDESFERMHYILGRYERTGAEFYRESYDNNCSFAEEPIKIMSKLTKNLLHAVDYDYVKHRRTENFALLHRLLGDINQLSINCVEGAFMYPLMIAESSRIRKQLQKEKIYIPVLWPNVLEECDEKWEEWLMAQHILPLPCDQRYGVDDMICLADQVKRLLKIEDAKADKRYTIGCDM